MSNLRRSAKTPQAHRPKGGRKPLAEDEAIVQVGIKMPISLEEKILAKVIELRKQGYHTSKAHLIRTLAEYMLDCASEIFGELEPNGRIRKSAYTK